MHFLVHEQAKMRPQSQCHSGPVLICFIECHSAAGHPAHARTVEGEEDVQLKILDRVESIAGLPSLCKSHLHTTAGGGLVVRSPVRGAFAASQVNTKYKIYL